MELEILRVMKQGAGIRFSCKEIGRIVDRSVFRNNPHWARPILEKLVAERVIWNEEGYYVYPTEAQRTHQRVGPGPVVPADVPTHRLPPQK